MSEEIQPHVAVHDDEVTSATPVPGGDSEEFRTPSVEAATPEAGIDTPEAGRSIVMEMMEIDTPTTSMESPADAPTGEQAEAEKEIQSEEHTQPGDGTDAGEEAQSGEETQARADEQVLGGKETQANSEEPAASAETLVVSTPELTKTPELKNKNTPIAIAVEEEEYRGPEGNVIQPEQIWGEAELLKSPRFLEALESKGLAVSDLRPRALEEFKGPCNAPITAEQRQMRYAHYEKRRVMKALTALRARAILMAQDEAGLRVKAVVEKPALSSMILEERERVSKAKKRVADRNAQLKEHEDKMGRIRQEKLAEMARAEEREWREKEAAILEAQQNELEREKRFAEHKAETAANFEKYFTQVQERRQELEVKEKERQLQMAERREKFSQQMKEKQAATQKRIDDCLEQDKRNVADKRDRYEAKKKFLAIRQAEKEEAARVEQLHRDEVKLEKKKKVEAARLREKEMETKRQSEFTQLKEAYEERQRLKAVEDEKYLQCQLVVQAEKHQMQLSTRREAERIKEALRDERIELRQEKERKYDEFMSKSEHIRIIKKEERWLAQQDRVEFREQFSRIDQRERQLAMDKIEEDTSKYEARKSDVNMLLKERSENRKQAHAEKVTFAHLAPGPGEYNANDVDSISGGGFGIKLPTPGERDSPGPAAYSPNMNCVLRECSKVKMGKGKNKTALDFYMETFGKIPAPNEYTINRDLTAPCMVISEGQVMGPLEKMLKAKAAVPAPHDYGNAWADTVEPMEAGTNFGKEKRTDPTDTPQKFNPSPAEYAVNMNGVRAAIKTASLNTAGEKTYLEGLQAVTSKVPGPGSYKVQANINGGTFGKVECALPVDGMPYGSGGITPADKGAITKLLHARLSSKSPVANAPHHAIDCSGTLRPSSRP